MGISKKSLAERIKTRRLSMKLGLREAAKSSELSLSMWQYIETGKTENPRLNTLHKVAKTLKCNVGDLVD